MRPIGPSPLNVAATLILITVAAPIFAIVPAALFGWAAAQWINNHDALVSAAVAYLFCSGWLWWSFYLVCFGTGESYDNPPE